MILIPILLALALDCHPVAGDRILGSDLAAASAAFAGIPAATIIGNAPLPGARRFLSAVELSRIARANSLSDEGLEPICLERLTEALDPAKAMEAMTKSLAIPDGEIEILELSRFATPRGEVIFPRETLPQPGPNETAIWKGYVSHSAGRAAIWANVRIAVKSQRVVAAANLQAGHLLSAGDVRVEEFSGFPRRTAAMTDVEEAIGRAARRAIRAGAPLFAADLTEPNDVERGQTVRVEVRSGGAVLKLEATAESAGRRGDTIPLRNLSSGKIFRARVQEKGLAVLEFPSETESPK
jgi:flagella basal body P-ring formation protein FlgA